MFIIGKALMFITAVCGLTWTTSVCTSGSAVPDLLFSYGEH